MNYRHIYHAGNICDVVKHATLTLLLGHMRAKDKGFTVIDTHAGTGLYDLSDERAGKTDEAKQGVLRLMEAQRLPALCAYYDLLQKLNPDGDFHLYPGSPRLVLSMLREQDRLIACELHPEDARELKHRFWNEKQITVHNRDGYEALLALTPPETKRGMVLIDPPFEQTDEFEQITKSLIAAHKRWPIGVYAIWYPIKDRPALWTWQEQLITSGIPKILCAEFIFEEEVRADRLNGSGMVIVNPPWKLDEEISALYPELHKALGTAHQECAIKMLTE
jgi:23S rRNA (adenine2030-N6)-methyltransferase